MRKLSSKYFEVDKIIYIFVAKNITKIEYKPKTVVKMQTKTFTSEEIRDLKIDAIARKYKCSNTYARSILKGERERNTELAQKIVKDAVDMQNIINRETIIEA